MANHVRHLYVQISIDLFPWSYFESKDIDLSVAKRDISSKWLLGFSGYVAENQTPEETLLSGGDATKSAISENTFWTVSDASRAFWLL